jgi:hypothetical protein
MGVGSDQGCAANKMSHSHGGCVGILIAHWWFMSAASEQLAFLFAVDAESQACATFESACLVIDEGCAAAPRSGIVLMGDAEGTEPDEDDRDDEFMMVTLEEVELVNPCPPPGRRRGADSWRPPPRASERRNRARPVPSAERSYVADRVGSPKAGGAPRSGLRAIADEGDVRAAGTERIAGAMGALVLLVAIAAFASVAAQ